MKHLVLANEVRLGNLVMNAGGKIIIITAEKISDLENKMIVLYGIKLTKQLLVDMFGFEERGEDTFVVGELNSNFKRELVLFASDEGDVFNDDRLHQIKTVHHLQNLYHANNLKELKIKSLKKP